MSNLPELLSFKHKILGRIILHGDGESLTRLEFSERTISENPTPLLVKVHQQLLEYFAGGRQIFDFSIVLHGSHFQNQVWKALQGIPYGNYQNYKDVSLSIGQPNAFRAVGNANGKNPIPIIIPCHRVVKSDGSIGGYSQGIFRKQFLLELESQFKCKGILSN